MNNKNFLKKWNKIWFDKIGLVCKVGFIGASNMLNFE